MERENPATSGQATPRQEMYVVDLRNYKGNIQTVLYDSKCPFTGKSEKEFIQEGYTVMAWDDYEPILQAYLDSLCGDWCEITEEQYEDALNVLPPALYTNGGFFMSERYMHDVSGFYQKWYGAFYTSYQRMHWDRSKILESLQEHIKKQTTP